LKSTFSFSISKPAFFDLSPFIICISRFLSEKEKWSESSRAGNICPHWEEGEEDEEEEEKEEEEEEEEQEQEQEQEEVRCKGCTTLPRFFCMCLCRVLFFANGLAITLHIQHGMPPLHFSTSLSLFLPQRTIPN
jgi:hypothetical protein